MDRRRVVNRKPHSKLHVRHGVEHRVDDARVRRDMFTVARWREDRGVYIEVGRVRKLLLQGLYRNPYGGEE